jgi:hypothetical protein
MRQNVASAYRGASTPSCSGASRSPRGFDTEEEAMGFFNKILDKLGIGNGAASASPQNTPAAAAPKPAAGPAYTQADAPDSSAASQSQPQRVDVAAQMEQRAAVERQDLNWRTSIVDLLKLLDIDSSLPARKELARELGCPPELMEDSAKMNVWLHKTVLERIAANGGKIPEELLD